MDIPLEGPLHKLKGSYWFQKFITGEEENFLGILEHDTVTQKGNATRAHPRHFTYVMNDTHYLVVIMHLKFYFTSLKLVFM